MPYGSREIGIERLHGMGKLRIPRDAEIAGLDYNMLEAARQDEKAVSSSTR